MRNTLDGQGSMVRWLWVALLCALALVAPGCKGPSATAPVPRAQQPVHATATTAAVSAGQRIAMDNGLAFVVPPRWTGRYRAHRGAGFSLLVEAYTRDSVSISQPFEDRSSPGILQVSSALTTFGPPASSEGKPDHLALRAPGLSVYAGTAFGGASRERYWVVATKMAGHPDGVLMFDGPAEDPRRALRQGWSFFHITGASLPATW